MTKQLTKEQISALKVFLADYGVNVSVKKPSKKALAVAHDAEKMARIQAIEAWKPETTAGKQCKANMLRWLNAPESKPCITAGILRMFGVRPRDVNPWPAGGPNQKAQMLVNGIGKGVLALTYLKGQTDSKIVWADAAAPITRVTTTYGTRSYREMNIGVFPATETAPYA